MPEASYPLTPMSQGLYGHRFYNRGYAPHSVSALPPLTFGFSGFDVLLGGFSTSHLIRTLVTQDTRLATFPPFPTTYIHGRLLRSLD